MKKLIVSINIMILFVTVIAVGSLFGRTVSANEVGQNMTMTKQNNMKRGHHRRHHHRRHHRKEYTHGHKHN